MKKAIENLRCFRHKAWMWIVYTLIACLEADLRGRALDWLYHILEKDARQLGYDRYGRVGGRYHREPR